MIYKYPGGICLMHGPYKTGDSCPQWPSCITAPYKQEWIDLANKQMLEGKRREVIRAVNEFLHEAMKPSFDINDERFIGKR